MKKVLYILLVFLITSCHAFVGGGGGEGNRTSVIFNVSAISSDSCRCRANKFKIDSNLGARCRPIDSMLISYSRNGNMPIVYTDSIGLTQKTVVSNNFGRYYFIKKGFSVVSAILNFDPKSKMHVQASGCDVFLKRIGTLNPVYYVAVVIKPNPKKGVKLIPYNSSKN
jgi:hypothetical protein